MSDQEKLFGHFGEFQRRRNLKELVSSLRKLKEKQEKLDFFTKCPILLLFDNKRLGSE